MSEELEKTLEEFCKKMKTKQIEIQSMFSALIEAWNSEDHDKGIQVAEKIRDQMNGYTAAIAFKRAIEGSIGQIEAHLEGNANPYPEGTHGRN